MDRWAERFGINVEIVQIKGHVEAIDLRTAGEFEGITATDMGTLSIPAGSDVNTMGLTLGTFSNGSDAVISKGGSGLEALVGMSRDLKGIDLSEAFKLGDRVIVFDKTRRDPHDPAAYGTTITYDFDARHGGIPYQLKEDVHDLEREAPQPVA